MYCAVVAEASRRRTLTIANRVGTICYIIVRHHVTGAGRCRKLAHAAKTCNIYFTFDTRLFNRYELCNKHNNTHRGRTYTHDRRLYVFQFFFILSGTYTLALTEIVTACDECTNTACEADLIVFYSNKLLGGKQLQNASFVVYLYLRCKCCLLYLYNITYYLSKIFHL